MSMHIFGGEIKMLEKTFKGIRILEKSLNLSWLKNETISNNIANVNTPNYKREDIRFESVLNDTISSPSVKTKLTHEKHMPVQSFGTMNKGITKDFLSKTRKDGNNVNIDVEMANLAKNQLIYNTLSQRISGHFSKLKLVIKDGR